MNKLEVIAERVAKLNRNVVLSKSYKNGVNFGIDARRSGKKLEDVVDENYTDAFNAGIIDGWLEEHFRQTEEVE